MEYMWSQWWIVHHASHACDMIAGAPPSLPHNACIHLVNFEHAVATLHVLIAWGVTCFMRC